MDLEIKKALTRKDLQNQKDVVDVITSEIIHEIEDEMKKLNEECNEKEKEVMENWTKSAEEITNFLSEKYSKEMESIASAFSSIGIKKSPRLRFSFRSHHDLQRESFTVSLAFDNDEGPDDGRWEVYSPLTSDWVTRPYHFINQMTGYLKSHLSFEVKFSDLNNLPITTRYCLLLKESEEARKKWELMRDELDRVQRSKSKILTNFKRQSLERNKHTKDLLAHVSSTAKMNREQSKKLLKGDQSE